jgi:NAD(P)-dependent dehydrogenase (short-subunit alcohol dehydrogenase family)
MTGVKARHAGRVALVTGGSNGIGQAIAVRLAAEGARVAVLDVAEAGETLARVAAAGGNAFWIPCDLASETEIRGAVAAAETRAGPALILVHAAAVQFVKPIAEVSSVEWRHVQAVNQEAAFHLTQALLPGMRAARWGRIVFIVSSTFWVGGVGMAHYVTSKGALIGLAHGLCAEIGEFGVTVNCLAPGLTRTAKAVGDLPDEFFRHIASVQSIKRNGLPEDQAGAVSFLVADDAAFMTGQTLVVDGGQART